MRKFWGKIIVVGVAASASWCMFANVLADGDIDSKQATRSLESLSEYSQVAKTIAPPKITQPQWYKE